ncbi:MAG TPA: ATP-binding protein [Polyangiaceae bacterium]|nr:ATP-binding protein [Polyangiaceae bacterium]
MRLTLKLTLVLTLVTLLFYAANSMTRIRREVALFENDIRGDNLVMGRAIAGAVARIWKRVGESEALDLVEDANERESHVLIRWVWLDAPAGDPHAPEVPKELLSPISRGESVVHRWQPAGKAEAVYTWVPVLLQGGRHGAVEIKESMEKEQRYVRQTILHVSISTLLLVLLNSAVTLGLGAYFVGRPVRLLVEQARRIGSGDLSSQIHLRQRDEISELAEEMSRMSEQLLESRGRADRETVAKLTALEQLRHSDRLATVGKLASGVAHEVGTPLNVIIGHAQLIADEYPADGSARENSSIITQQAHRVTAIVRQLLDFARQRPLQQVDQDLAFLIKQVASLLDTLAKKRNISIDLIEPETTIHSLVDPSQMQQVLTNLVINALQASPGGNRISIGLERTRVTPPEGSLQEREYARLFIRDQGSGISPEALPHIFEPFFTTKDTGEGTGLGLSVAYGIVKEHGGWIAVDTAVSKGSCFSVYLPLSEES